ncbi:MAG: TerC family protein [Magnetococcales bacterium]|nr:TerC family protein [Magnetococcales bacterium]
MESVLMSQFVALVQVIFIDLVLAGDNAIVVGMAAASVPVERRKKVVVWGTAAAVILRILFALVTTQLLKIIGLTLAGGLLLLFVAWQMFQELKAQAAAMESDEHNGAVPVKEKTVMAAVWQVAMADLSMSLDNVLAVAGAAKDHLGILVLGLLFSVVMMAFAANYIAQLIHKHRWVAWVGLAIITYVAFDMVWRGSLQVAPLVG